MTGFAEKVEALAHDVEDLVEGERAAPAVLPQDDPDPAARARGLAEARTMFRFSDAFAPPMVNVDGLPAGQAFTDRYDMDFVPAVTRIVVNQLGALDEFFKAHPEDRPDLLKIPQLIHTWRSGPHNFLNSSFFTRTLSTLLDGKQASADRIEDYPGLYRELKAPAIVPLVDEDWMFAYQRVAGFNPTVIERIEKVPDRMPLADALFRAVTGENTTLEAAGKDGRLYLCDYALLDGIPGGVVMGMQKFLTAPLALFCRMKGPGGERLMPVAIQLAQKPSADAPIFTPLDGIRWKIAKIYVSEADGNHHQTVAHLYTTHLRVEPIIVATHRELAATHPIAALLAPHFTFTLAINENARDSLLAKGGVVDLMLGSDLAGSVEIMQRANRQWRFDEAGPEALLRRRGVDDPALLPQFPFRDDTLLLWKAILGHVERYLDLYYRSPQDMVQDAELQGWARCLVAKDGADLAGMALDPAAPFADLPYLKRLLAQVIYTASAQHASVNYAQYPLMSYSPGCPLALYGPPPTAASAEDAGTYLKRLPPIAMALWQMAVADLLTSQQWDELGNFGPGAFVGPSVERTVGIFQAELATIETTIAARNATRPFAYELQLPSRVPNSISI